MYSSVPNRRIVRNKRAGGKILKNIKCADPNRRAGGNFFSKSINVRTQIRPCRGDFLLKINKRACTSIRHTRVPRDSRYQKNCSSSNIYGKFKSEKKIG